MKKVNARLCNYRFSAGVVKLITFDEKKNKNKSFFRQFYWIKGKKN